MVENGCGIRRAETSATDEFVFTLTPSCEPRDVEPMSGEPNHMEEGIIHNPRDGLLTLVFYIDGEEGFTDSNGNGLYDPGEPFFGQDLAEPYVDENDNSQFDTNEPYIDLDENGEWSEANGRWDEDTLIWKKVHILFSGMPHESVDTTRFEPSGINIDAGGSQTLTLYLMDINHNPLAVNGDGTDIIEFTEGKGGADITSDYNVSLTKTMGVEFTSDGNIIIEKFNENRSYQVTLSDSDPEAAEETSVLTDISWTPAPEHEDYSPTTLLESLTAVSGMAN